MWHTSRREFLRTAGAAVAGATAITWGARGAAEEKPEQHAGVEVLHPMDRVPVSFIIDDSTCLVNMGYFCTPQFGAAFPNREVYQRPWKTWEREIPDMFLREFGEWCADHGVKGKFSIIPYPSCVGWLDRELPGWSRRELHDSLKLVRELMVPNWDIHPEMISHTLVIDLKTGRPFPETGPATIENSYPQEKKSVDELAAYIAYALRILKNCDLPCEGITTPGGFGNVMKSELSLAVQEAVREVYAPEIPHYFKYISSGDESTEPKLEHVSGLGTDDVRLTVNIPAGTGDWFGSWQGVEEPEGHRYCNEDATEGRMVELIQRGQPAPMFCHWPGLYCNGTKKGFKQFQAVIEALEGRFRDRIVWMKLNEIARYSAAKELTSIQKTETGFALNAPFAAPQFTVRIAASGQTAPRIEVKGKPIALEQVPSSRRLKTGTWARNGENLVLCFDLPKGESKITV